MPYQARYMMVPVLRWAEASHGVNRVAKMLHNSVDGPDDLVLQVVDSLCLIACGWVVLRLRRAFTPLPLFAWLAPFLLLWVVAITYAVRYDQRLVLPYDFLALLFLNLGLLACVEGRGWLLLAVMCVATYNRETTVFLIPVWLACHWGKPQWKRPALIGALGLLLWAAVKLHLRHLVHGAAAGLEFNWNWNLAAILIPHHWAQLLSIGGYFAIPLWLGRRLVTSHLLRMVWLGFIPFLLANLIFGVWNETRIWGELSLLVACTAALQFEQLIRAKFGKPLDYDPSLSGLPGA